MKRRKRLLKEIALAAIVYVVLLSKKKTYKDKDKY